MGCCGKHKRRESTTVAEAREAHFTPRNPSVIFPADGCEMCAEKHLSTAFALAGEAGYVAVNRQRIIGELTACALHLFKEHAETSEKVRAIRHLIQQRRETEVDWMPLLAEIDALAAAEAKKLLEDGK